MNQALGQLHASLHSARKCFNGMVGAVLKSNPAQHLGNPRFQMRSAQPVEVALVAQVFHDRKFDIETPRLEDDADLLTDSIRLRCDAESGNARDSAGGDHERRKNPEQRGLSASIGTEQTKDLSGPDVKRQVIERQPASIVVSERLDFNRRSGCRRIRSGGRAGNRWFTDGKGHHFPKAFNIMKVSSRGR